MKKLLSIVALVATMTAFGAGEYELARKFNFKDASTWTSITKDNLQAVYDSCKATNDWYRAQVIAAYGYTLGNKELYLDWASTKSVGNDKEIYLNVGLYNKLTDKGQLFDSDPDFMVILVKKLIDRGDYVSGVDLFTRLRASDNTSIGSYLNKDLIDYINSKYTPEVVKSLRYGSVYAHMLRYFKRINTLANYNIDIADYWDIDAVKYSVNYVGDLWLYPEYNLMYSKVVIKESNNPVYRIKAAKYLDKYYKNKEASISIYPFIYEKSTWKELVDLAFYLEDADKVIEIFSTKLTDKVEPADIAKFIEMIVGLDASYRKAEILKILENINNKCTLKLYDDSKTWEPVIAKVRAMIDLRK